MAKNIETIAEGLGAKVVAQVPDVGGGAFGAAQLTIFDLFGKTPKFRSGKEITGQLGEDRVIGCE